MITKRVVVVLTFNNGVLYRTRNFIPDYRYTANFVDAWSVDEVVLLDITRPGQGDRHSFYSVVKSFSENCFVPLAIGGGVRSLDDFRKLLSMGADKVVVNTGAVENPDLITQAARKYGSQCVVVCMDCKKENGEYAVVTNSSSRSSNYTPAEWAALAESLGAGEILVQSVDLDGTLEGYDNELNRLVSDSVGVPVLANCGAGRWQDFVDAIELGGVEAVCTQNIYHFTEASIVSAKKFLVSKGVDVRI